MPPSDPPAAPWRRLLAVGAQGVASGTPYMVGTKLLQGWLTASRGAGGADWPAGLRRIALHLEDVLGASPGSLAPALARSPPRLAVAGAAHPGGGDRRDGVAAAQPSLARQPGGGGGHGIAAGGGERHPGHAGGCLPHRPPAPGGAGSGRGGGQSGLPGRHAGHRGGGLHSGGRARAGPGLRRLSGADGAGAALHLHRPNVAAPAPSGHQPAPGGGGARRRNSWPAPAAPGRPCCWP